MADRIRRVVAIAEQIVESFVAVHGLVLAKRGQQVGEGLFWDVELAYGRGQGDEYGVARTSLIAGVEFRLPFVEQEERCPAIAGFVSEVVGDAAVGVDVEEMLPQALGEKPGGD